MSAFKQVDTASAIERWNKLALNSSDDLTIAHNPALFHFFSGYLNAPTFYIFLVQNDKDVGLFPLVKMGNKMVSLPHLSYGGVLWLSVDHDFDEGKIPIG